MSNDRTAALRNAEKLIRQGKLEAAIAVYVHIVEDAPTDWNTANVLGDLYARAGQIDQATTIFGQIAASLAVDGALAKAAAVYKKILKLKPDSEDTLLQMAELLTRQSLFADARTYLNTVLAQRQRRGDLRGAAAVRVRLGTLAADDYASRLLGAKARVELEDVAGAVEEFKAVAMALAERGQWSQAIDALTEAVTLDPADEEARTHLLDMYLSAGDFASARASAASVEQFAVIAATLEARGRSEDALATLEQAAQQFPGDPALPAELLRALLDRGDLDAAAKEAAAKDDTTETAGDDPAARLRLAGLELRRGHLEEGDALVRQLLQDGATGPDEVVRLACELAPDCPNAGFRLVELVTESTATAPDWSTTASAWQAFVAVQPRHIPALMRLVEVCVDGGLDETLPGVQGLLADAYLDSGAAMEGRFIAEDLTSREPWVAGHVERLRRALTLSGETDPDRAIADWLAGESPFSSTDLMREIPKPEAVGAVPDVVAAFEITELEEPSDGVFPVEDLPAWHPERRAFEREERGLFTLSANAIDLAAILGDLDPPPRPPSSPLSEEAAVDEDSESVEVDLSTDLSAIKQPPPPIVVSDPSDLEGVFAQLRTEASQTSAGDVAEGHYARGLALRDAGNLEACLHELREAARSPSLRWQAASLLGRILAERGSAGEAIGWFEHAAQAPAPSAAEGYALLYDFARVLEQESEPARALAVLLELQAQAGAYQDVTARVERLTNLQAGG